MAFPVIGTMFLMVAIVVALLSLHDASQAPSSRVFFPEIAVAAGTSGS